MQLLFLFYSFMLQTNFTSQRTYVRLRARSGNDTLLEFSLFVLHYFLPVLSLFQFKAV